MERSAMSGGISDINVAPYPTKPQQKPALRKIDHAVISNLEP